ncbi:hypothetical protein EVAR_93935_1 [Eumeta japonica]|uniref:Uncharacterized protein n=1 Tax=Eumeta variegata TaxID=151549 RepID=A0A4C1TP51_EUMVA|nr:hypothetical protein EVAR_93935_1 [Eumeta japonica]
MTTVSKLTGRFHSSSNFYKVLARGISFFPPSSDEEEIWIEPLASCLGEHIKADVVLALMMALVIINEGLPSTRTGPAQRPYYSP